LGWFITKDWLRLIRKISINTLKYLILIIGAISAILPFYWMFTMAVSSWGSIPWLPLNPHFENFIDAWNYMRYPPLWRALLNSVIVSVSRTLLVLFASSLTAYALAIYKFRGSRLVFWIILSAMLMGSFRLIPVIPGIIALIPSVVLVFWLGWLNTYWALIIPGFVSAFTVFLLRQYMITIPDEVLDAARLYGCSELGLYWRIILPLSKPALAAIGLINFVWSWNDFLWPLIVISDDNMFTVQLALSWASPYGYIGAALITLVTLPLIIFTIITQKYLIKGLAGLGYARR